VRLTVDLPGVLASDLDVAIQHGILTITGARQTLSVDGTVVLKKHKFSRRYAIDTDVVDVSQVNANLSHGVLTVKAPKRVKRADRMKVHVSEGNVDNATASNVLVTTRDSETHAQAPIAPVSSSHITTSATQGSLERMNEPSSSRPHGEGLPMETSNTVVSPDEDALNKT
jgi:hypothetical protein